MENERPDPDGLKQMGLLNCILVGAATGALYGILSFWFFIWTSGWVWLIKFGNPILWIAGGAILGTVIGVICWANPKKKSLVGTFTAGFLGAGLGLFFLGSFGFQVLQSLFGAEVASHWYGGLVGVGSQVCCLACAFAFWWTQRRRWWEERQ